MRITLRDGSAAEDARLGRIYDPDERDRAYPMAAVAPAATARTWRYWWPSGWWGDQGATPQCVAYAWLHKIADGPRTTRRTPGVDEVPALEPRRLYCAAQKADRYAGDCDDPRYDGTTVRAGARVLRRAGMIRAYRWAWDADTVVRTLLEVGPVVVGTSWHAGMSTPGDDGWLRVTGGYQGGHAYVLNGVNVDRGVVRVKNSWGRDWGRDGHAWLAIDDLATLLDDHGEACLPEIAT